MLLRNEVHLPAAPDRLFGLLLDVERVAPCMPGGALEGTDDDAYTGTVKVKVGPITAAYHGTVRFLDTDQEAQRVVLDARGVEQHGNGNAEARVTAQVSPHESGSTLTLDTDLVVRGRVAQFGRGVLGDVSQRLMEQFARNLENSLLAGDQQAQAPDTSASRTAAPPAAPLSQPAEPAVDGLAVAAGPLLKRVGPVVAAFAAGVAVGSFLRGRRTSR